MTLLCESGPAVNVTPEALRGEPPAGERKDGHDRRHSPREPYLRPARTPPPGRSSAPSTTTSCSHAPPALLVGGTGDLIARGETHADKKINALAAKVHLLVGDLRSLIKDYDAKADARAEVERLEAQLAAAREKAGIRPRAAGSTSDPSARPIASDGATSKQVRAWAVGKGIAVPTVGRIKPEVLDAYETAHPAKAVS